MMITAAYTICKNEITRVHRWIEYTKHFDYRVVLDCGSTDGTYEILKKVPGIILDQYSVPPEDWRFDIPRNLNLNMVPESVDWALSPDIDEFFSINVLTQMEKTIKENPEVTNISCTRLDIYSETVFVGPPKLIGTNKIHRRHEYNWKMPIYEFLQYIGPKTEVEIFNSEIYLVHDQETNKPRSTFYPDMMKKEYKNDPTNSWNTWYLANHYYREKDLENFVEVGMAFINHIPKHEVKKRQEILGVLNQISMSTNIDINIRKKIRNWIHLIN
jgi:hypothetical protein